MDENNEIIGNENNEIIGNFLKTFGSKKSSKATMPSSKETLVPSSKETVTSSLPKEKNSSSDTVHSSEKILLTKESVDATSNGVVANSNEVVARPNDAVVSIAPVVSSNEPVAAVEEAKDDEQVARSQPENLEVISPSLASAVNVANIQRQIEMLQLQLAQAKGLSVSNNEGLNTGTSTEEESTDEPVTPDTPEDEWGEIIDAWIEDVSTANSGSDKTRRNYRKRIADMLDYLTTRRGSSSPLPLPKRLTEEHYRKYNEDLMERKGHLQKNTLRSYLIPIWSFGTFVSTRYDQDDSRAKVATLPSGIAGERKTISRDEFMMVWETVSNTNHKLFYTLLWFFHIRNEEAVYVRYCDIYVQDNAEDIEKQRLLREKARKEKEETAKRLIARDMMNRRPFRRKKQPVPVDATATRDEFGDITLKRMIVVFVNKPKGGPTKKRHVAIPEGCVAFEFLKNMCGRNDERYVFPYRGSDDRVPMCTKTGRNWMNADFEIHKDEITGKTPGPHDIRHSSATYLKKIGMPEHQIGKRLGHGKKKGRFGKSMTSLYTDHDDIRDAFDNKWLLQL